MLGDIVSTNTLLVEEMLFSVIVIFAPLAFSTCISNVAYDYIDVDGTVTVALYAAPFTVAFTSNPNI